MVPVEQSKALCRDRPGASLDRAWGKDRQIANLKVTFGLCLFLLHIERVLVEVHHDWIHFTGYQIVYCYVSLLSFKFHQSDYHNLD